MKTLFRIFLVLFLTTTIIGCSKDNDGYNLNFQFVNMNIEVEEDITFSKTSFEEVTLQVVGNEDPYTFYEFENVVINSEFILNFNIVEDYSTLNYETFNFYNEGIFKYDEENERYIINDDNNLLINGEKIETASGRKFHSNNFNLNFNSLTAGKYKVILNSWTENLLEVDANNKTNLAAVSKFVLYFEIE